MYDYYGKMEKVEEFKLGENKIMKKIFILVSVLSMFILTGCVNIDLTLDIEKNGDAKVIAEILGESYIMEQINESEFEGLYDEVEKINEGTKTGYRFISKLDKSDEIDTNNISEYMNISEDGGVLSNTYIINARIKDAMFSEMSSQEKSIISMVGKAVPVEIHIKSPFKLEETNATSVEEAEGKTVYNWDYTLGSIDNIYIKAKVPNFVGIVGVIAIVILVCILLFMKFRKKKKNNEE